MVVLVVGLKKTLTGVGMTAGTCRSMQQVSWLRQTVQSLVEASAAETQLS